MSNKILKNWEKIKLKKCAYINPESITNTYQYKTINYIDIASVGSGLLNNVTKIQLSKAPSRAQRILRNDDVILSTVRPNRRSFYYFAEARSNYVASTGFAIIRAKKNIAEPKYLYYSIIQQSITKYLTLAAKGSAYPAVDSKIVKNIEISLPPLFKQKKIASILSAFDELIEINRRRIKILEEMAHLFYREWFVEFRFPGHEKVKMVNSKLGRIPKGWKVDRFNNTFSIRYGKNFPVNGMLSENKGRYPVYGAGDVIGYCESPIESEKVTLITCRGNGSGTVWRTRQPAFITNNSLIIKGKKLFSYLPYYFIQYLMKRSNIDGVLGGAAQPQLTIDSLSSLSAFVSPQRIINEYKSVAEPIETLIDRLLETNKLLSNIRDLLLPKLMSGEIEV